MPTTTPQWFALDLGAERDQHGSSLGGNLSRDGLAHLAALARCEEKREVAQGRIKLSLTEAWRWMMGEFGHAPYDLRTEILETPNLYLTVPGDAAGVYTENEQSRPDRGCSIGCHNMDNPAQALACLAGLATFSEILEESWRESGKTLAPLP